MIDLLSLFQLPTGIKIGILINFFSLIYQKKDYRRHICQYAPFIDRTAHKVFNRILKSNDNDQLFA